MQGIRNPVRSEADAFRLTAAGALLAALSVLLGWLTAPLAGVVLFVVLGAIGLAAYLRAGEDDRHRPLREAAREPHRHPSHAEGRHVLVVANEPLHGQELRRRIMGDAEADVEVNVLAPLLTSRAHLAVTDIDGEIREARERLARSLSWAQAQGLPAHGEIGDPNPIVAIEDELRRFGADEVIVVTSRIDTDDRQEQEELRRLRSELDVPVVHVASGA